MAVVTFHPLFERIVGIYRPGAQLPFEARWEHSTHRWMGATRKAMCHALEQEAGLDAGFIYRILESPLQNAEWRYEGIRQPSGEVNWSLWRVSQPPAATAECPECFGTGHYKGFGGPCPRACPVKPATADF